MAIDPEDRAEAQAVALADLVDFLAEHGLDDRIAFTEVHNEVQVGHLADGLPSDDDARLLGLRPRLERASTPSTPASGAPGDGQLRPRPGRGDAGIPEDIDVLVTHPYVYGVLDDLHRHLRPARPGRGLRPGAGRARPAAARRAEAHRLGARPAVASGTRRSWPTGDLRARLGRRRGDRPLALPPLPGLGAGHDHHAPALAGRSPGTGPTSHGVPLVFGEGWIGYTPRDGRFEEGPSAPSSAGSPSTNPSASGPGAPSSAPTPHRSTPCGPTSPCSRSATRPSWRPLLRPSRPGDHP